MATNVYRHSDKPRRKKRKKYSSLQNQDYGKFRKHKTLEKKPPVINPINKVTNAKRIKKTSIT